MQLLTRDEFRESVFKRDANLCVCCQKPATAAHHIVERKLFPNGGYYLSNGASLCDECHIKAEQTVIGCDAIRFMAGINEGVLPEGFDPLVAIDKWGNPIIDDHSRKPGPLYPQENGMVWILRKAGIYFVV